MSAEASRARTTLMKLAKRPVACRATDSPMVTIARRTWARTWPTTSPWNSPRSKSSSWVQFLTNHAPACASRIGCVLEELDQLAADRLGGADEALCDQQLEEVVDQPEEIDHAHDEVACRGGEPSCAPTA